MAKKTYVAAQDLTIQQAKIAKGDVVGRGDVEAGEFTAAEGLENFVELGHVIPRLALGRIKTRRPGRKPKAETAEVATVQ